MRTVTKQKLLRVGELAKAVKKTVRAMHLYEELGLIKPTSRSAGGYRLYTAEAIERVRWIGKLQDMGFSLTDVQGFVRQWEDAQSGPEGMNRVRATFEAKLAETRQTIEKLTALEKDLADSLAYLDGCHTCHSTAPRGICACCDEHGHDPRHQPSLVAGLALPEKPPAVRIDVPLGNLKDRTWQ
jgi:MerR family transcriptional regulator, copper efflux regulator